MEILNHFCYFHFMYLICHSSRLMSLLPSHTMVHEQVFFPTGWVLPQSRWKFFIPDKCGVLYIIRTYYKAQCISIFFSECFNNKLYFPSTYLNGSLSRQDSLPIYKVTFDVLNILMLLNFISANTSSMQCLLPVGWPHMFYGFTSWTHQLCSQCLAYMFSVLVSFEKCSFNSIAHYSLTNKTHSQ